MTISRTLKIVMLAGFVSLVGSEAANDARRHQGVQHHLACRSGGGASPDAGQRGWRGPSYDTALRGRRI